MTDLQAEIYLTDRADNHGLTLEELMDMTPDSVADSYTESAMFWEDKHMSHIYPKSIYPHMASDADNIMPEDGSPNMARGAVTMTDSEIAAAHIDNEYDAMMIDILYTGDTESIPYFGFF